MLLTNSVQGGDISNSSRRGEVWSEIDRISMGEGVCILMQTCVFYMGVILMASDAPGRSIISSSSRRVRLRPGTVRGRIIDRV